jgi:hypothetical protein
MLSSSGLTFLLFTRQCNIPALQYSGHMTPHMWHLRKDIPSKTFWIIALSTCLCRRFILYYYFWYIDWIRAVTWVADAVQRSYCLISRHFHVEVLMPYVRMVHHFLQMLCWQVLMSLWFKAVVRYILNVQWLIHIPVWLDYVAGIFMLSVLWRTYFFPAFALPPTYSLILCLLIAVTRLKSITQQFSCEAIKSFWNFLACNSW